MLTRRSHLLTLTVAAMLTACISAPTGGPTSEPSAPIHIGGGVRVTLPAAPGYPERVQLAQLISTVRGGRTVTVQSEVRLGPDEVIAVFSLPGGPPAMTIRWRAGGVDIQKEAGVPAELDGARILADIFLTHWPVEAVRAALEAGAVRATPEGRQITAADGAQVAAMRRERGDGKDVIRLKNTPQGYDLKIISRRTPS